MAKTPKKPAEPELPIVPRVGDKVTMKGSASVRQISRVYIGDDEVDVEVPGTNLQWFRVRTDTLTFVERMPPAKTSNPFTTPEPAFDAAEVLQRIRTVQKENLQGLGDDLDILKAYLKTQHTPEAVIEALESLTVEQNVSWKKAMDKVRKVLE